MLPQLACTQDRARSIYEAARDKARAIAKTEAYAVTRRQRQKVEMHFAHLKRILRLDRLRLRAPSGAKDEFLLAATAQNLRELAKLTPLPAPYSPHEAAQLNFASPAAAAGANSATGTRGFSHTIHRERQLLANAVHSLMA